jgi:FkbM family methyltransferase
VLTVAFAELGYKVYAVEGSPRNFEHLVDNTSQFPNVTPILMALHEKNQVIETRFNDCISLEHPVQKISYLTLPDLMTQFQLPPPKFIKMDIEGMETLVLKQCDSIFQNDRPIWQLSVHDTIPHSVQCVYDGFPGFVPVSKGGYDFSNIFKFGYEAYDFNYQKHDVIGGFNEYFLIPKELVPKLWNQ